MTSSVPKSAAELGEAIAARQPGLADTRWHTVDVVDATGSTNADLAARAGEPDLVGTVRITMNQTAGRGRRARVWSAPPGAQIAISAVLPVENQTEALGWLSLATGVAAAHGIGAATSVKPVLKWPNDVLVDGKKIAGILAEYVATDDGGIAVVGIGINTEMAADELPVDTATSLRIESGQPVDVAAVAVEYLRWLSAIDWPRDLDGLAEQYRQVCDTIGRRVRLILPDSEVVGTAVGVDHQGRIVLTADDGATITADDGATITAAAGDVVHLRPVQ